MPLDCDRWQPEQRSAMGRPYENELALLRTTYEWCAQYDGTHLVHAVEHIAGQPLVAIGSGGSMTTAVFAAQLHTLVGGQIARTSTPLCIDAAIPRDGRVAAWLFSAGGSNSDVLQAFDLLSSGKVRTLCFLTARRGSALAKKAKRLRWPIALEFDSPAGRDGFLATNSLLASCTLLARAYLKVFGQRSLPESLDTLLLETLGLDEEQINLEFNALWARDTTLALHGVHGSAFAHDLESKFTEAALGSVQPCDLRNFAHGRHNWLARRPTSSSVVALVDPDDRKLANSTLQLVPEDVPTIRFDLSTEHPAAAIAGIYLALAATGSAGRAKNIDPGRPKVQDFGRRLYDLKRNRVRRPDDPWNDAISRKTGFPAEELDDAARKSWVQACEKARERLESQVYRGVVFDWDGTIVPTHARWSPPEPDVVKGLLRLLEAGVLIGIASGRGGSVRDDLQKVLPEDFWSLVTVGYRNGSEVSLLASDYEPIPGDDVHDDLAPALRVLKKWSRSTQRQIRSRWKQITIRQSGGASIDHLWRECLAAVASVRPRVQVVRSGHSVDVLPAKASKVAVVRAVSMAAGSRAGGVLRIGDQGAWPGNDFDLLNDRNGLSVDEVSPATDKCWKFAPEDMRGVSATLYYLDRLVRSSDGIRLSLGGEVA